MDVETEEFRGGVIGVVDLLCCVDERYENCYCCMGIWDILL